MKTPKLYRIHWIDASDYGEKTWADKDELKDFINDDVVCLSVGYFVSEDNKYLTIAGDFDDGNFGRVMKIPKVNIKKREVLK